MSKNYMWKISLFLVNTAAEDNIELNAVVLIQCFKKPKYFAGDYLEIFILSTHL